MILFLANGRLGNQLFQYAFLRTIAKDKEKILTASMNVFVAHFTVNNPHFFNLRIGPFCELILIHFIKPILLLCARLKIIGYVAQSRSQSIVFPTYKKRNGLLPITLVESDFYQSEKFFDQEKLDFKIKEGYIKEAKDFLSAIPDGHEPVFVHIRRGDYIFTSSFGIEGMDLPKKYFEKAIKIITKKMNRPFFIFISDDTGFVECCFDHITNKIISKKSMATDLAIMSMCDYGIVSNSSFSWWGAYMMKNRKAVIFPKYWLSWKSKIESIVDIYPNWAEVIEV